MNSRRGDGAASVSVIEDLLCFDLYAASRSMTSLYRPLLAPLDLTYPQFLVLQVLTRRGPTGIGELGQVLHLDYGTTTPLLRRLEDRGLIIRAREQADQRARMIMLSEAGHALRPELDLVGFAVQQRIGMDEDEIRALQQTLRRLTVRISD